MICTETNCPGSAVGDSKNEQWDISFQDNAIIATAISNNQMVRVYTGHYFGNSIRLTVQKDSTDRSFEQGKMLFSAVQCISCHTMKGEGGAVGPALTQLGTRFSSRDILESILEPNKVISDQYAYTSFYMKDGKSVTGRLKNEDSEKYYISQNPFAPQTFREVMKKDVVRTRISDVSSMYPGMINSLNKEELKDLMAYLVSGSNENHQIYKAKAINPIK